MIPELFPLGLLYTACMKMINFMCHFLSHPEH